MRCDAFDAAAYARFAARARIDGDWELATIFQKIADEDHTHYYSKEAEMDGPVASTAANLRNAIQTELSEANMFKRFAREANEDGDGGVATVFERVGIEKAADADRLEAALAELGVHSDFRTITA